MRPPAWMLAVLFVLAAIPPAASTHATTFRFDLADGEAVALRLNLTGGEWPIVQASWHGCADANGVPPGIAEMRLANGLQDGRAGTRFEGETVALRAEMEQQGYFVGATDTDTGGERLERRCSTWISSSHWSGPHSETRIFQSSGDAAVLYLLVRETSAVVSMDVVKLPGQLYDRNALYNYAGARVQALSVEVSAHTSRSADLYPGAPFVGWFAPQGQRNIGEAGSPNCYAFGGRCDHAPSGVVVFSDDRSSSRVRLGQGPQATVRAGTGDVAGVVLLPEGYVTIDRTPPVTFVSSHNARPDGSFPIGAEIHLDATDDKSGLSHIVFSTSVPWYGVEPYVTPFAYSTAGTHCFWAWAYDMWGNEEAGRRFCVVVS